MTALSDLKAGDQFLFIAQVVSIDGTGYHLALYGPGSVQAALAGIDLTGVMSGNLANTPDQIPVTVVTGFAPVTVGDVLSSDRTGETMVARTAWITPAGVPMWSNTVNAAIAYPATGWTVIGHVSLLHGATALAVLGPGPAKRGKKLMFGIDYAFNPHPGAAAIKAAGAGFVCRYVSAFGPNDGNGKNLLSSELRNLLTAGLKVVIVAEEGGQRMLGGHVSGVTDATHANSVVKALGMAAIPVYFACDWDATQGQQGAIDSYLDGAASVIGHDRTGIYGGYWPVSRALNAGKAAWAWQTIAWSGGNWDARADIEQGLSFTLAGASVDINHSMKADFGQWPRPIPVPPNAAHNPVTGLALVHRGYTSVTAAWNAVPNAKDYSVVVSRGSRVIKSVKVTTPAVRIGYLTPFTSYDVRVRAQPGVTGALDAHLAVSTK